MTLFAKLTGYNTFSRLILVSTLWLAFPRLPDWPGFILLMGILLLAGLTDGLYVHWLLRPLLTLVNRKLRVIQPVDNVDFLPLSTTTLELTQLDEHINDLMHRLSVRFACERAFTAYASHELLTPIAILRTRFDNLITDKNMPPNLAIRLVESQQTLLRLSKIVQILLRLARIENHQYQKNESVSIRAVLQEILFDLDDRISMKDIQVDLVIDQDIILTNANHSLIYTMLLSLVGNAVRHNSEQGQLTIHSNSIGNVSTLLIGDAGAGMTPEQVATLTQYGHPAKSTDESTGIGLQLILTIATFHRITLRVDAQSPPMGTRITLTFD